MTRERFASTSSSSAVAADRSAELSGAVLVAGPVTPPRGGARAWFHAGSGLEGLGLLTHGGLGEAFAFVLAHARLPDMGGIGFLERVGTLCPHTARVLLLEDGESVPDAEQLARLGLDDAWATADGNALDERLTRERGALDRTRALRRRLGEALERVETLEGRCRALVRERGRLAGAFGRWLERHDAPAGAAMERWWRAYREWLDLSTGRCPVHARAVPLAALLPAGPEGGTVTGAERVRADPVHARRAFLLLGRGASEWASGSRPRFEPRRGGAVLRIPDAAAGEDAAERLLDPFARLPGEPLAERSMDLVLARALLEAQAGALRVRASGVSLVLEASLPPLEPVGGRPL